MKHNIIINNINKNFNKVKALNNINLEIISGEIFGFIGPNGAGKSTLIRTMMGLLKPDNGSLLINDIDVIKTPELSNKIIGYVPSDVNYPDVKVKDLFNYTASFYQEDLTSNINQLIKEFDLDINKNIKSLSLGNLKKVAIINALMHQPKVIILDEATSGLDPLMQQVFFKQLLKAKEQGTTIFFSSHNLEEVSKICDRIAFIKEGNIIKVSDVESLNKENHQKISFNTDTPFNENTLINLQYLNYHKENNLYTFLYHGDINQLIEVLAHLHLINLKIETLSLEEIFIHYYE